MGTKSKLATSDIQAASGNYSVGRSGKKIGKITIHHSVIAKASASDIARVFTNPKRKASANYCIGYTKGDICCSLYEENRAWTSSSPENDNVAITMEVANSSVEYPYPVSDDTLENIIELCVDICKRYNFRLNWTGDKNGTLTVHRMFAATACPGEYLMGKMPYIAEEVNRRLDELEKPKEEEPVEVKTKYNIGDNVSYHTIYSSSSSEKGLKPLYKNGIITKIVSGAKNPYLIGNGTGWINDNCIVEESSKVEEPIKVGDNVKPLKAVSYDGVKLASFVLDNIYPVIELIGKRAVLGNGLNTAFNIDDLKKM